MDYPSACGELRERTRLYAGAEPIEGNVNGSWCPPDFLTSLVLLHPVSTKVGVLLFSQVKSMELPQRAQAPTCPQPLQHVASYVDWPGLSLLATWGQDLSTSPRKLSAVEGNRNMGFWKSSLVVLNFRSLTFAWGC